jgi:GT2 family glycosyltransferase
MLRENLSRLKKRQPIAHRWLLESGIGDEVPALSPVGVGPRLDLGGQRATTILYFGVDAELPALVEQLNGENNVVLVENRPERLANLLASTSSDNLTDPSRVFWLCSTEAMQSLQPVDTILGGLAIVKQGEARRSELAMDAFRKFNSIFRQLSQSRQADGPTYLIMLTWNRLDLTIQTLNRLKKNTETPYRLVIADNGSTDGTVQWLRENKGDFPSIEKLLCFDENLGVGRALNNGIVYAAARSRQIGRIDNDLLLPPNWLRNLNSVLHSPMSPAIVSAFIANVREFREAIESVDVQTIGSMRTYAVDLVGGCCTLFRHGLFNDLGFLPEYPLYGVEDGGLCKAVRDNGETIALVESVAAEHLATPETVPHEYLLHKQRQVEIALRESGYVEESTPVDADS